VKIQMVPGARQVGTPAASAAGVRIAWFVYRTSIGRFGGGE